jgi:hypothetical protein
VSVVVSAEVVVVDVELPVVVPLLLLVVRGVVDDAPPRKLTHRRPKKLLCDLLAKASDEQQHMIHKVSTTVIGRNHKCLRAIGNIVVVVVAAAADDDDDDINTHGTSKWSTRRRFVSVPCIDPGWMTRCRCRIPWMAVKVEGCCDIILSITNVVCTVVVLSCSSPSIYGSL